MKSLSILEDFEWWPLFKRYTKFCVVGVTGMMVDMGILWLLADPSRLGWNLTLSQVIAAEVAIFNNFLWNDVVRNKSFCYRIGNWSSASLNTFATIIGLIRITGPLNYTCGTDIFDPKSDVNRPIPQGFG